MASASSTVGGSFNFSPSPPKVLKRTGRGSAWREVPISVSQGMPSIWNAVSRHPHHNPEKGHSLSPRRQHYQERNGIHTVISEHTEDKGFAAGLEFKLEVLNRARGQPPPHWQRSVQQPIRKEESPGGQGSPLGKASIQMANF